MIKKLLYQLQKIKDYFLADKSINTRAHTDLRCHDMHIANTYFEAIDREKATDDTFFEAGAENNDIILFIHICKRKEKKGMKRNM